MIVEVRTYKIKPGRRDEFIVESYAVVLTEPSAGCVFDCAPEAG